MKTLEKEELTALRDNCKDSFIEIIQNTTKEEVRTYCLGIASTWDLIYLSKHGKTIRISEEAWEIFKPKATNEDLIHLSKHGKTTRISEEARELLHEKCSNITKFI